MPSETQNDDLLSLPKDTGGTHTAVYYVPDLIPYGYYLYTPSGYEGNQKVYPLMVFLHGAGEKGNSQIDPGTLNKVLANGPPYLINAKKWAPRFPMIVLSPQCHDSWWIPSKVHQLIETITRQYRINTRRIYMTGLSMGGFGTFAYIEAYSDAGFAAAGVPICGGGDPSMASKYQGIPIWAFHGEVDNVVSVSNSIGMVNAINSLNPAVRAKLTLYPNVGHNSWSMTYDGSGMGAEDKSYDAFDESICDWFFKYTKDG